MLKSFLCLFLLGFGLLRTANAQEIIPNVTINLGKLQTADPKLFKNLKTAITEFLANRKWTDDEYLQEEKIELTVLISLTKELSASSFQADLTIQAARPVFGTSYNTVIFQHVDSDFSFAYNEFEVLDFNEATYTNELTAVLGFYTYISLGFVYDSFSELGGDAFLQKAQGIINMVPPTAGKGWRMSDATSVSNRSRYWLAENVLNNKMQPFRRAWYQYHLLGLDLLSRPEMRARGLGAVSKALEIFQSCNANYPATMLIQLFSNMKRAEILDMFLVADVATKRKIYDIMQKLDASRIESYKDLLK